MNHKRVDYMFNDVFSDDSDDWDWNEAIFTDSVCIEYVS